MAGVTSVTAGNPFVRVDSSAGFAVGDRAILLQVIGANAGNFDVVDVIAVAGNTLTVEPLPAQSYSTANADRVQLVEAPCFSTLDVQTGGSITTAPWDGTTGGVVAFFVAGELKVRGTVSANGLGLRGGVGGVRTEGIAPLAGGFAGANVGADCSTGTTLVRAGNGSPGQVAPPGAPGGLDGAFGLCRGGNGGFGGSGGPSVAGNPGAAGEGGTLGGAPSTGSTGATAGLGANSNSNLRFGGGGGGGSSGNHGTSGGGGGGGGGRAGSGGFSSISGSSSFQGGEGGAGGRGGAGGGVVFVRAALYNIEAGGSFAAAGRAGLPGNAGLDGAAGGAGGNGASAATGGGGGGGGGGGAGGGGGNGGDGGGGGGGGTIDIQRGAGSMTPPIMAVDGGTGANGGTFGDAGRPGEGGIGSSGGGDGTDGAPGSAGRNGRAAVGDGGVGTAQFITGP